MLNKKKGRIKYAQEGKGQVEYETSRLRYIIFKSMMASGIAIQIRFSVDTMAQRTTQIARMGIMRIDVLFFSGLIFKQNNFG